MNKIVRKILTIVLSLTLVLQLFAVPVFAYDKEFEDSVLDLTVLVNEDFESENAKSPLSIDASPWGPTGVITSSPDGNGRVLMLDKSNISPFKMPVSSDARSATLSYDIYVPQSSNPAMGFIRTQIAGAYCVMAQVDSNGVLKVNSTNSTYEITRDTWHRLSFTIDYDGLKAIVFAGARGEELRYIGETPLSKGSSSAGIGRFQQQTLKDEAVYFDNYYFTTYADLYVAVNSCSTVDDVRNVLEFYEESGIFDSDSAIDRVESESAVYESLIGKNFKSNAEFELAYNEAVEKNYTGIIVDYDTVSFDDKAVSVRFANASDEEKSFRVYHLAYSVCDGYNIPVESFVKEYTLPAFDGVNTVYETSEYTFVGTADAENLTFKTIITDADNHPVKCITYGDDTAVFGNDISDSLSIETGFDSDSGVFTVDVSGVKSGEVLFVSALGGRYTDAVVAEEAGSVQFTFKINSILDNHEVYDTFVVDSTGDEKSISGTYETNKVLPVIESVDLKGPSNIGGYLEVSYDGYFQLAGLEEDKDAVIYKWYVSDSADIPGTLIDGADERRFEIDDEKYGEQFITASVRVVSADGVASREYFSSPSPVMLAPKALNVVVSGAAVEGNILAASYDYYHATNPESGSVIRWIAVDSEGRETEELANGTLEYTIKTSDIGKTIAFSVTPCTDKEPEQGLTVTVEAGMVVASTSKTTPPVASEPEISDSYDENVLTALYTYTQSGNVQEGESIVEWYVSDENGEEFEFVSSEAELAYKSEYDNRYIKFSVSPVSENDIRGERIFSDAIRIYSVPRATELSINGRIANGQKLKAEYIFPESLTGHDRSKITWYIGGEFAGEGESITIPEDCTANEIKLVVTPVSSVFPHLGEDSIFTEKIDIVTYAPAMNGNNIKTTVVAPAAKYGAGNMTTYKDGSPLTDFGEPTYLVVNPANSNPWISGFSAEGIVTIDMRVYLTAVEGRTSKSGEQIRVRFSDGKWSDFFTTIKSGKFNGNDEVKLNENQWYNLRFVLDNDDKKISIYYGSDENHLERVELAEGYDKYTPGHTLAADYLQFAAPSGNAGVSSIWNINSLKVSSMPPMYIAAKSAHTISALVDVMNEYEKYSLFDYPSDYDSVDDKEFVLGKVLGRVNEFESTSELEAYFASLCNLHQNGASVVDCRIFDGSDDISDKLLSGISSVKSVTELISCDGIAKTLFVITALYENNANGDKTLCGIDVKEASLPAEGSVSVTSASIGTDEDKNYSVSVLVWNAEASPSVMLSVKNFNGVFLKTEVNGAVAPSNGVSISKCIVNPVTGQVEIEGNCAGGDGQYLSFEVINPMGERVYVDEIYSVGNNGSFSHSFTLASASVSGEYSVRINLNKTSFSSSDIFTLNSVESVEPTVRTLRISGDNCLDQTVSADYEYYQIGGVQEKGTRYTWYVSSSESGQYIRIDDENDCELTLDDSYRGKYIKVEVAPVSANGIEGVAQLSAPVRVLVPPSVSNVKISGEIMVGKTVAVTYKFVEALYGLPEYGTKYEWYVGSELVGTEQSYKIKSSDSGKYIKCVVTPGISEYPFYGTPVATPAERIKAADSESGKGGSGGGGGGGGGTVSSTVLPYTPAPQQSAPSQTPSAEGPQAPFEDTADHWANASIAGLYAMGIVRGVDESHYNPDGTVTRAEFAALINRITGYSSETDISFSDVSADAWYYDDVKRIAASGIMQGSGFGFRPDDNITREEMALVARRVYTHIFGTVPNITPTAGFVDYADISAWAYDAVMYCQNAGIVVGDNEGRFNPQNHMTRAEAAVVIERLINLK